MKGRMKMKKLQLKQNYYHDESGDAVDQYSPAISRIPLLTAKEEIELAKAMELGRRASRRLQRDHLSTTEHSRLTKIIRQGNQARERLIEANSRLVVSIAKKYRGWSVPFPDLIQEGNLGLIHAADKFDFKRGFRFSTYATWWIRQSVTRAIAEQGRTIRLPVHTWEKVNQLTRVSRRLEQELGHKPTPEEVAEEMGTAPEKVERLIKNSQQPLSLEMPLGENGDAHLSDIIPDEIAPEPSEAAAKQILRDELGGALSTLSAREERVLKLRFGLNDGRERTLDEIGAQLGKTRERIRQIEMKALRKLRHPAHSRKLRGYLEN